MTTPIICQPAAATAAVSVVATPPRVIPVPDAPEWTQSYAAADVQPWIVVQGKAVSPPPLGIAARSAISIGERTEDYTLRDPLTLDIDADLRWLATTVDPGPVGHPAGYDTAAGLWYPASRDSGFVWTAPGGALPEGLDLGYSYDVRRVETAQPAVAFDGGGQRLALDVPGVDLAALTVVIVAVLHPVGRGWAQLLTTVGDAPLSLRYYPRSIQAWTDTKRAEHDSLATLGRPVAIALCADAEGGRMHVMERTRSSDSFDTTGLFAMPLSLVLGATDIGLHPAVMDVVEIAMWTNRALTPSDVEQVFGELDDAYRITG